MNKPLLRFVPLFEYVFSLDNAARHLVLICFFLLFCPVCLWAKIVYTPYILGCPASATNLLVSVSRSFDLQERPPLTIGLLQKRADKDIPKMVRALKSLGYYQAQIVADIQKGNPAKLFFRVAPGKQFRIGVVSLRYVPAPEKHPLVLLPFESEEPAVADTVLAAEKNILRQIGQQGYPFPLIKDRQIQIRHDSLKMHIQYTIQTGPYARFGTTILTGLKKIDPDYIRFLLPWQPNDEFNIELLSKARKGLIKTGLFSSVACKIVPLAYTDKVQIKLDLQERKKKTIKAGIGYSKDKRLLRSISWENRNFLGGGENLKVSLEGNEKGQEIQSQFRKPWLWQKAQTGILSSQYKEEGSYAYFSQSFQSLTAIERQLGPHLWGSLGMAYRLSNVIEDEKKERYRLFSVPLTGYWENLDNMLDPTHGLFFRFAFAPHYDTLGTDTNFIKFLSTLSAYVPLWKDRIVFSVRSRYGIINGITLNAIPADIRFYSGGSRSVRGYSYQKAGKIKRNGNPLGGRSVFECSGELHYRIQENYGLNFFLDGGRAFTDQLPNFKKDLFWGTGIGFVYYTQVGPLHFDVATPLDRRKEIDSPVQVYIGLGIAF